MEGSGGGTWVLSGVEVFIYFGQVGDFSFFPTYNGVRNLLVSVTEWSSCHWFELPVVLGDFIVAMKGHSCYQQFPFVVQLSFCCQMLLRGEGFVAGIGRFSAHPAFSVCLWKILEWQHRQLPTVVMCSGFYGLIHANSESQFLSYHFVTTLAFMYRNGMKTSKQHRNCHVAFVPFYWSSQNYIILWWSCWWRWWWWWIKTRFCFLSSIAQ